jgi:hypothetical protein
LAEKGSAQHAIELEIHRQDRVKEEERERARVQKWREIWDQQNRNLVRKSPENS